MMAFPQKPYYSPTELARYVSVSHDKILDLIHSDQLFAIVLGPKTFRIPLGSVLAMFAPDQMPPVIRRSVPNGTMARAFEDVRREEDGDLSEREELVGAVAG